jgi:ketosteroid isomerase-like protein
MRVWISAVLLFSLVVCVVPRDSAQERPEVAGIHALEAKWVDAYKKRQITTVAGMLAEDYVITLENGTVYGKTGFVSYNAGPLRVDVAEVQDLRIRIHENVAVVTGAYHEQGVQGGKSYDYHDRLTDVWMKIGGRWQLIASHYSVPAPS